jgi:hypothetical protein
MRGSEEQLRRADDAALFSYVILKASMDRPTKARCYTQLASLAPSIAIECTEGVIDAVGNLVCVGFEPRIEQPPVL